LKSSYVVAAEKDMPKAGDKGPWRRRMNYFTDMLKVKYGDLTEGLETYQEGFPVNGIQL
jgi:hypothetical protein